MMCGAWDKKIIAGLCFLGGIPPGPSANAKPKYRLPAAAGGTAACEGCAGPLLSLIHI